MKDSTIWCLIRETVEIQFVLPTGKSFGENLVPFESYFFFRTIIVLFMFDYSDFIFQFVINSLFSWISSPTLTLIFILNNLFSLFYINNSLNVYVRENMYICIIFLYFSLNIFVLSISSKATILWYVSIKNIDRWSSDQSSAFK